MESSHCFLDQVQCKLHNKGLYPGPTTYGAIFSKITQNLHISIAFYVELIEAMNVIEIDSKKRVEYLFV
ncbi:unnamed protein product [Trifolium pratense]|uniref:Uncharacterized protein n=1 Tax=Trifolium pratense TaxID=57577 RepID=A0ACB0JSX3_TRIPR|nr:unnamed protein product [Trifolium pratense]